MKDRLVEEAKSVGLELIGAGRNRFYRLYRFINCNHEQEMTIGNVRINNFRCRTCLDNKLAEEAKSVGLELIGAGRDRFYRLYRFIDCNHEQEMTIRHVRKNNFRCQVCLDNKLIQEAKSVGLELIGAGKDTDYRLYRFTNCNHKQEIQTSAVRKNEFRCRTCLDNKLAEEAKSVGLELIGAGKNAHYRLYRFTNCGHEQEIQTGGVRKNEFRCQVCLDNKLIQEAKSVGLELIGAGKDTDYRLYRFTNCNHEQEMTIGSVRNGYANCSICNPSPNGFNANKPAYFYVIHYRTDDNRDFIKYGITNRSIKTRSKEHIKTTNTKLVNVIHSIKFEVGYDAYNLECKFREYRKSVGGYIHKSTDLNNGHTETLSVECLEYINEIIENNG